MDLRTEKCAMLIIKNAEKSRSIITVGEKCLGILESETNKRR